LARVRRQLLLPRREARKKLVPQCEVLHIRGSLPNVMFHRSRLWVEGKHAVGGGETRNTSSGFSRGKVPFNSCRGTPCCSLVQGTSLKSSAEALGIKYETVRSYLKSAFLKTGTHRQAELVLRVFQAMSDPNPPAVPAAMSAQELRTAVQNGRGTPRTIEAPPFGGLCRTKAAPPTERSRTEPTREAAMAAPRSGP
jgi:hypothetical protein